MFKKFWVVIKVSSFLVNPVSVSSLRCKFSLIHQGLPSGGGSGQAGLSNISLQDSSTALNSLSLHL